MPTIPISVNAFPDPISAIVCAACNVLAVYLPTPQGQESAKVLNGAIEILITHVAKQLQQLNQPSPVPAAKPA